MTQPGVPAGRYRVDSTAQIVDLGGSQFLLRRDQSDDRFLLDEEGRVLIELLDGCRSADELREEFQRRCGSVLSADAFDEFVAELSSVGFLDEPDRAPSPALAGDADRGRQRVVPLRALSGEDPGARVNAFFDFLAAVLGWLLHPLVFALVAAVTLFALGHLIAQGSRFLLQLSLLSVRVPLWLLIPSSMVLSTLIVDLPRELAVGTACRRFGGRVRHFGFQYVEGIFPVIRCDTGDSIAWMTNRGRWSYLGAAPACQALVTSLLIFVWSTGAGGRDLVARVALLLIPYGLLVFLFLVIPFGTREGYVVVLWKGGVVDLRPRAKAALQSWLRFWREDPEPAPPWLALFGLGQVLWTWSLRILFLGGGFWWLSQRHGGTGALMWGTGVILWYRDSISSIPSAIADLRWKLRKGGSFRTKVLVRTGIAVGVLLLGLIPYDREVVGDARVIPRAEFGARAQITDEIVKVHVRHGDQVDAGSPIVTFSGRDVDWELRQSTADLAEARATLDLARTGSRQQEIAMARSQVALWERRLQYEEGELARQQRLVASAAAAKQQLDKQEQERDDAAEQLKSARENLAKTLEGYREEDIRAAAARVDRAEGHLRFAAQRAALVELKTPIAGTIVTPNVAERLGSMAQAGDLIAVVQDLSQLRVQIAAEEAAGSLVKPGMTVDCRLTSLDGRLITGRVASLAPATSDSKLFDQEAVRTDREALIDRESNPYASEDSRVLVVADLDQNDERLVPGMTGYCRIEIETETLGQAVLRPIVRFFRTEVWSWLP